MRCPHAGLIQLLCSWTDCATSPYYMTQMCVTGICQYRRWYSQHLQLFSGNPYLIYLILLYFRSFHLRKSCCIYMEVSVSGWLTYSTAASKSFSSEKSVYSTVSAKFKSLLPEQLRSLYSQFHGKSPNTYWHKAVFPGLQRAGKTPHELLRTWLWASSWL